MSQQHHYAGFEAFIHDEYGSHGSLVGRVNL